MKQQTNLAWKNKKAESQSMHINADIMAMVEIEYIESIISLNSPQKMKGYPYNCIYDQYKP